MPSISKKQMQEYEQYLKDRNAGRIITPDGLKLICASFDNNPQQIGAHFLSVLTKFRNEGVFEHRFVECVFFWLDNEENGYLSNWYNRSFSVNGISYSNTEQYFMAQKAIVFGDNATLKLIMKARSPKECKQLGRNVSPFDSAVWDTKSYEIMKTGQFCLPARCGCSSVEVWLKLRACGSPTPIFTAWDSNSTEGAALLPLVAIPFLKGLCCMSTICPLQKAPTQCCTINLRRCF